MTTPSPRRVLRQTTALVGAVCLSALVAACGSDSDASGDGGSSYESKLVQPGTLTYCSDISAPPLTYYDKDQNAVGTEIELGDAIAKKMGLKTTWKNVAFAGIIPAIQAHQCDAIMSQLYIKPEREKVLDFVPYMYAGNTVLVPTGNPAGVSDIDALCGLKVATQTGTTAAETLTEQNKKCQSSGEDPIKATRFNRDSEAQQQLKIGLVDAYATTVEIAGYAMKNQPGAFETVGEPFGKVETGIATVKDASALHDALTKAFEDVRVDGTYDKILQDWQLTGDALPGK